MVKNILTDLFLHFSLEIKLEMGDDEEIEEEDLTDEQDVDELFASFALPLPMIDLKDAEDPEVFFSQLLQDLLEKISYYRTDKDLNILTYRLTQAEKRRYLLTFSKEKILGCFPQPYTERYRTILNELCEKNDPKALSIRGFSAYGKGSLIADANWETCRNDFEKALPLAPDNEKADLANALGYIYYYGRCNNGKPQYNKAFYYFSIGSAMGHPESIYKTGDMMRNGYGVPQSKSAAFDLYATAYQQTRESFVEGNEDCPFADAALRMAQCFAEGIGISPDTENAYGFIMQADCAIRMRSDADAYGDDVVNQRIQTLRESLKEQLGPKILHKKDITQIHELVYRIIDEAHAIKFQAVRLKSETKVVFQLDSEQEEANAGFMLTFPRISRCELAKELSVYTKPNRIFVKDSEMHTLDSINFIPGQGLGLFEGNQPFVIFLAPEVEVRAKR